MQLLRGGPALQAQLCYSHTEKVLGAMNPDLNLGHTLQAHCYVTDLRYIPAVKKAWLSKLQDQVSISYRTLVDSGIVSTFVQLNRSRSVLNNDYNLYMGKQGVIIPSYNNIG